MALYNTEKYVGEAIESLLKSFSYAKKIDSEIDTYLIIRDDGSTDSSKYIIENKIKAYKNIFLLENEKNIGVLETRRNLFLDADNLIKDKKIKNPKDIYLSFLDSDDICVETRVFNQLKEFKNDSTLIGCGGQALLFKEDPNIQYNPTGILTDYKTNYDAVKVDSLFQSCTLSPCMSFRYDWIKKRLDNLDRKEWWSNLKSAEDWAAIVDFMIDKNFKYKNIKDVAILYRRHEKAMTNIITDGINSDQAKIRNKALSYINLELSEEEHLLYIAISPCRYWGIYNVDFFQKNQKYIYEMSSNLIRKIIASNKHNQFYNEPYLKEYTDKILNNVRKYQNMNLSEVPILLQII